ncbi:MAG: hypothetical protein ACUVR8_03010 [Acidobacteriota bacterium]
MILQTLGKFLAFGLAGSALGVVTAVTAGYGLQNYIGEEILPLLWLIGGLGGAVIGASQVSWRKRRRRRRRRHPQVVLPPMKTADGESQGMPSGVLAASEAAQLHVAYGEPAGLFQQATGATTAELAQVRVCDVRLDSDGEPLSVRLSHDDQDREVFLVHDHHRDIVAAALEVAMQREPGNRRAKLFP